MTDEEYIRYELAKAQPEGDEDTVRMKLRAESGGESRWVRLRPHVQDLLTVVASLTPEQADALRLALSRAATEVTGFRSCTRDRLAEISTLVLGDGSR